jgi:hypothetical protein
MQIQRSSGIAVAKPAFLVALKSQVPEWRHCRWSRQEIKCQSEAVAATAGHGRASGTAAVGGTGLYQAFAVDKADELIINSPVDATFVEGVVSATT